MGQLKYKGYSGSVEYSEEDNCLFGKVLGLRKDCITYEGETISELKSDFEGAIDDYLTSCKNRGVEPAKPYSGKLIVRMPSDLHGMVAMAAANAGTTINEFINRAVSKELENELAI
ncbi:type II toxin-antitoxin system HicB family antitoxin [Bacteroides sp.]|uniref:type II toxin-antitoxin system HicB family antitoxin n=1 Tax=Bacteroides sp. TaxID=29523 RepID=UPI0025BA0BC8|nr:type II toxin-antitoxin system HicB family antitoxin [Bacteroides sp.]